MSTFDRIKDLPLAIAYYNLEPHEKEVSSGFLRKTTTVCLHGAGHTGRGEDVCYDNEDHESLQAEGPTLRLAGQFTVASFSAALEESSLFPQPPRRETSRAYRRWAFESAALDLALRQANTSLAEALDIQPRPVSFVVSLRLGDPASAEPLLERLRLYPGLRFKLDPTSTWDDDVVDAVARTGAVDCLDFKAFYKDTPVDEEADPALYRRVLPAFPDAWLEDPHWNDAIRPLLDPHRKRITWDYPINSIRDIERLPFPPQMINIKPSRFGTLRSLFDTYDYCAASHIRAYGGGQFELGPGRGHIQYLASLFHPDAPNDVAPAGFHEATPARGLPESPLAPDIAEAGFRRSGDV